MKKKLLLATAFFSFTFLFAQDTFTCNEALLVTAGQHTVTSVDGTEIPLPVCSANGTGATNGKWYKYIPSQDYSLTITTDLVVNGTTDTRFQVYTGDCSSLVCHAGDDDGGGNLAGGLTSIDTFNVTQGVTYTIAFDDKWTDAGFVFEISETDPVIVPTAPVSFVQQTVSTTGTERAVVDMNGDFLDDIVSISATNVNILHQQVGGGFTTTNIGTPTADFTPSWSLCAADYDRNGYTDLLYGAGTGVTFMKANADGTGFTESSGSDYVFSQRSNFIDINNDGHLDAFVCHDVDENVYYINDGLGNLIFYQGDDVAGVPSGLGIYSSGGNYGSIWIDYDNDGDMDMFIAKCGGEEARRTNQMHRNEGNGDFTEVGAAIGLADPMQTWSSAWGDFDGDGDMDVFVGASSGAHKIMRNDISDLGTFTDVTIGSGVPALTATGHENVTYDFDNDGNLDIASNGHILFGNGDMTFTAFTNVISSGSFGDLNNDGFVDGFGSGNIYMNSANANNWLTINTIGTASNINGIGARIVLETASGTQIRDVRSGDGFRFMNTLNTHFGIGTETQITSITVTWPSGNVDQILNPNINETLSITEGVSPLSVTAFSVDNLILHPNPTTQYLNLNATDYQFEKASFMVFDMAGKMAFKGVVKNKTIDVSRLQSGNYILRISNNGLVNAQKFIKK